MKRTFKCQKGKNREAVAVAADALWQLQTGRADPAHTYVTDRYGSEVQRDGLCSPTKQVCKACALGTLMLARLHRFDAGWIESGYCSKLVVPHNKTDICKQLAPIFPRLTLDVIESVYEEYDLTNDKPLFNQFVELAWSCGRNFVGDEGRDKAVMAAIFRNIIANHGDFKPATGVHPEIGVKLGKSHKVIVVRKPLRKRRTTKSVA